MTEYTYNAEIDVVSHDGWPGKATLENLVGRGNLPKRFQVSWINDPVHHTESLAFKFEKGQNAYLIRDNQAQSEVFAVDVPSSENPQKVTFMKVIRSSPLDEIGQFDNTGFVLPPRLSSMFLKPLGTSKVGYEGPPVSSEYVEKVVFPISTASTVVAYATKDFGSLRINLPEKSSYVWTYTYQQDKIPSIIEFTSQMLGETAFRAKYVLASKREVKTSLKLADVVDKSYDHQIGMHGTYVAERYDPNRTDYFQTYRQQMALSNLATRVKAQPNQWVGLWITSAIVVLLIGVGIWRFRKSR